MLTSAKIIFSPNHLEKLKYEKIDNHLVGGISTRIVSPSDSTTEGKYIFDKRAAILSELSLMPGDIEITRFKTWIWDLLFGKCAC